LRRSKRGQRQINLADAATNPSTPVVVVPQANLLPVLALAKGTSPNPHTPSPATLDVPVGKMRRSTSDIDLARKTALQEMKKEDEDEEKKEKMEVKRPQTLTLLPESAAQPSASAPASPRMQRSRSEEVAFRLATAGTSGLQQLESHLVESRKILIEGKLPSMASWQPPIPVPADRAYYGHKELNEARKSRSKPPSPAADQMPMQPSFGGRPPQPVRSVTVLDVKPKSHGRHRQTSLGSPATADVSGGHRHRPHFHRRLQKHLPPLPPMARIPFRRGESERPLANGGGGSRSGEVTR